MEGEVKILIVNDAANCNALRLLLIKVGYKVWTASSNEKGLELAGSVPFDLVLTELRMPGVDGIEMLRKVKDIDPSICVIIIGTYPSKENAVTAIQEGAFDYLTRPFNIEELKIILKRAVERHFLMKEAGQKDYYQKLSILDGLTEVYNHRYFDEIFPRAIASAERYAQPLSLLILDIDDFKKYNDTFGHPEGDKLLKEFAQIFVKSVRFVDMVFRYGGEEFVILLSQTAKSGAVEVAKRIINSVKPNLPTTVSIGICSFPNDGLSKDEIVAKADQALYEAKHQGKNRFCIYGE